MPFDLSNNRLTLGDNAGQLTWQASKDCASDDETPNLLNSEEKREAFRGFVRASGGWKREEIKAWNNNELYALFLQWVAGDIREAFDDASPDEWDWEAYEEQAQAGQVSSNLFKADDGRVFFSVG